MTVSMLAPVLHWAADRALATPVLVFSERSVNSAASYLRSHLDARISYAAKANIHPLMLAALRDLVDEFNVTNLAHLRLVLDAGVAPERIAYVNPLFDARTAGSVFEAGVDRFVVDDERGLDVLTSIGASARLTLRLRPSQDSPSDRSVVRFGTTADGLEHLTTLAAAAGVHIDALSFFIGVRPGETDPATAYDRAVKELAAVHGTLAASGINVPVINIGGGFLGAGRRFYRDNPLFFDRLGDAIGAGFPDGVNVVCEPGRFLSEPAMAMLTRVTVDRAVDGRRMTHVDASAYAGLFETTFVSYGGADLTVVADRPGIPSSTQLLGSIMDSFDVIKRDVSLPPLHDGDLLLLPNTGAYSWSYTTSCEGLRQPDVVALPAELDALMVAAWSE